MALNFLAKIAGRGMDTHKDEDLATSIQEHLVHLLNIRQGRTAHLKDYGLPDIHEIYYNLPGSLEVLSNRIKDTVTQYEPRLINVEVALTQKPDPDADDFRVTYRIRGDVVEGSQVSRLTFQTEVARDGVARTALVKQYG